MIILMVFRALALVVESLPQHNMAAIEMFYRECPGDSRY